MEQRLTRLWYRESPGVSPLAPLAWVYGAVVRARRRAYARGWLRAFPAGRPVVVVGNLTVGGTGKTPLVIWLAAQLTARGLAVGIVSRGHGGDPARAPRLVQENSRWQQVGDEPLILFRRTGCPTVVCRDRVAGARVLAAQGVDVILADDGLQHLRLERDCEILVIDGARGFGNGRMLPAGPLREPVARASAADVIVMNGVPEHASLAALISGAFCMRLVPASVLPVDGRPIARTLEGFQGEPVHAVAGIGHPGRFFGDLRARGLTVIEHPFPDHHPFAPADLAFTDAFPVLMTEKDAVKCRHFTGTRLWYLPVAASFSEPEAHELLARVSRKLGLSVAA